MAACVPLLISSALPSFPYFPSLASIQQIFSQLCFDHSFSLSPALINSIGGRIPLFPPSTCLSVLLGPSGNAVTMAALARGALILEETNDKAGSTRDLVSV